MKHEAFQEYVKKEENRKELHAALARPSQGSGMLSLVIIAVLVTGGVFAYQKFVKQKPLPAAIEKIAASSQNVPSSKESFQAFANAATYGSAVKPPEAQEALASSDAAVEKSTGAGIGNGEEVPLLTYPERSLSGDAQYRLVSKVPDSFSLESEQFPDIKEAD